MKKAKLLVVLIFAAAAMNFVVYFLDKNILNMFIAAVLLVGGLIALIKNVRVPAEDANKAVDVEAKPADENK